VTSATDREDRPAAGSGVSDGFPGEKSGDSRLRRGIDSLIALGPFALALTVYGLLLDHLQDDWFKYEWLKYVLSGLGALSVGMVSRAFAVRFRSAAAAELTVAAKRDGGVLTIHKKLARCSAVIAADLRVVDQGGKVLSGWSQFIGEDVPPTAIGTSYGLRIAMALDIRHPALDRFALSQSLLAMQKPGGGWAASSQKGVARPEVTAWVLSALCRCGLNPKTKADLVAMLHAMALEDPMVTRRTTVATTMLSALTEIQPGSPLVRELANVLVNGASRDKSDGGQLASWGENLDGNRRDSPAHTARAVVALSRAASALQGDQALLEVCEAGTDWLCRDAVSLEPLEEQIRRPMSAGNADAIFVGHFTASWVARALMCGEIKPERLQYVTGSVRRVIESQEGGIWGWKNGEKPIWTSYQGVMTLREYGLRGLKWPP
jgi:hypothetical protein